MILSFVRFHIENDVAMFILTTIFSWQAVLVTMELYVDRALFRSQAEMATARQLDDITECPICTEVYTDPRVLPCVHTYCLKCIEKYSEDKQPGDELACPLCRK